MMDGNRGQNCMNECQNSFEVVYVLFINGFYLKMSFLNQFSSKRLIFSTIFSDWHTSCAIDQVNKSI